MFLRGWEHPNFDPQNRPVAWGNKRGVQNDHFLMAKSIYEGGRFLIFKIVFVKSAYIFTQKAINQVYKLIWSTAKSGPFLSALAILHCGEMFSKFSSFRILTGPPASRIIKNIFELLALI